MPGRACGRMVSEVQVTCRHHVRFDRSISHVRIRAAPCCGCPSLWGRGCRAAEWAWAGPRGRCEARPAEGGVKEVLVIRHHHVSQDRNVSFVNIRVVPCRCCPRPCPCPCPWGRSCCASEWVWSGPHWRCLAGPAEGGCLISVVHLCPMELHCSITTLTVWWQFNVKIYSRLNLGYRFVS